VTLDIAGPGVAMSMAPIAYDHKVFIGNAGGDQVGVTGHVYALDADTGRTMTLSSTPHAESTAHHYNRKVRHNRDSGDVK
jgi:outer membrane protein assembly factor BamB